jgi:hypothetical protein
MKIKACFYIIFSILFLFTIEDINAQCAMCRAVLENNADNSVAEGINDGIVYLMIFPYLLMGGLGYYIYKTHQKKKKAKSENPS